MISRLAARVLTGGLVCGLALCTRTAGKAAGEGERLYEDTCRKCHGSEGRGTAQAPRLVPFKWSYDEALELVRRPVCDMPPIPESALSDAQVAQVVAYLKSIE